MRLLEPAANRGRVRQLANEGLGRQGNQTFEHARAVGENYLEAIASEAGDTLDGVVARVAREASVQKLYPKSAYEASNRALVALAAGVGGPIGPALASVGYDSMHKSVWYEASMAYHDGRSVGAAFLDGIAANSSDEIERQLATTARASASDYLYNQTAFQVEAEGLRRLRDGVAGQDLAATLASFGRAARMASLDNENARKVAGPVLRDIASRCSGRAAVIAEVAQNASATYLHQEVASLAQDAGFAKILEAPTGTLAQDLADLGTRALGHCRFAEDQRNLGHEILRGIKRHAADPAVKLLAEVADQATCPRLYNVSAAGAHLEAFSLLAGGGTDRDTLLARFGLGVLERGQTVEDSKTMGHGVLEALSRNATDPVKKGVLEGALAQSSQAASEQVAVGVQRFAFNWVTKAPTLPAPAPGSAGSVDSAVLEQRIGLHESIKTMLEEELSNQARDLGDKQNQMQTLADRFNPLVPREHRLLKLQKLARIGFFAGAAVGVAGLLLNPGVVGAAVHTGLLVGGGVTALASMLATNALALKRKAVLDRYWPDRNAYDQLDGEQQALQAASLATRAMIGPIEGALEADRSRLEVVKISNSVGEHKETGAIKIQRDMVVIGGVRLNKARPKVAPGEDREAPAVAVGAGSGRSDAVEESGPCQLETYKAGYTGAGSTSGNTARASSRCSLPLA